MSTTATETEATSADTQAIFGPAAAKPTPPPAAPVNAPAVDPATVGHVEQQAKDFASKKFTVKAKTSAGVNYAAAFLLFCKGISLQEIADEFGMTYSRLVEKSRSEDWDLLAKKSAHLAPPPPRPDVAPVSAALVERKQALILANREAATDVATTLRGNIIRVLRAYELDNAFLRPEDILTLAKAAKLVDDTSMAALGDEYVTKSPGGPGGGGPTQPPIIINLPSAVSRPREQRAAESTEAEGPMPGIETIEILGARAGEAEAVKAKVGHSINFEALDTPHIP